MFTIFRFGCSLKFYSLQVKLCLATLEKYSKLDTNLLDLGCGEGFFAASLFRQGWKVNCIDFSNNGISNHNPELLPFFHQGDILSYISKEAASGRTYGLLNLNGVLEHVLNPKEILSEMRKVMDSSSIARITVPNDFSKFQMFLTKLGFVKENWVVPPEHLNYFNNVSLQNLITYSGFETISLQADFPIEQFLLNEHSNYWSNPSLGKEAHKARMLCTSYLAETNISRYIDLREASADLDFGRTLTAFIKLS